MKKTYGSSFSYELSEKQLFQMVYSAYLAELKYFVKIHQKKGDKK